MKLAFSTLGCPEWSLEKITSEAKRMGYDAIELRGIGDAMNPDQLEDLIAACDVPICDFGTSVSFHDAATYDDMLLQGKQAIDMCARRNIPAIRVFGDRIETPEKEAEVIARVIRGIRALCEYAQPKGIQVWHETHGDFNTIERVTAVASQIGMPNFGILWDIWHSYRSRGRDYAPFYEAIREYIRHIHIKDCTAQGDLCSVGAGDVPITQAVKRLMEDGYDGFFSLEWEKRWHPELPEPESEFENYMSYMRKISSHKG